MKVLKLQEKACSKKTQAAETIRKKRIATTEEDVRQLFHSWFSDPGREGPRNLYPFSCSRKIMHQKSKLLMSCLSSSQNFKFHFLLSILMNILLSVCVMD